jgi:hypothetical protein
MTITVTVRSMANAKSLPVRTCQMAKVRTPPPRATMVNCGDALEQLADDGPCLRISPGHDGWPVAGTLLATRHTGADEPNPGLFQVLVATSRVAEQRVTPIDDDVSLVEQWSQVADDIVDG